MLAAAAIRAAILGPENELTILNYQPATHSLWNQHGWLTSPSRAEPQAVALDYVKNHAAELGLLPNDVETPFITDSYTDEPGGMTHVYLQQEFKDLPVANANLTVNVTGEGRVFSVAGGFVRGLGDLEKSTAVSPRLLPSQALGIAAGQLNLNAAATIKTVAAAKGLARRTTLSAPELSLDSIPAKLQYVPTAKGVELSWDLTLRTPDGQHWYSVSVGDRAGAVVFASDWVDHATYNVYARPIESPLDGSRSLVIDPADATASPYGWQDTNGVAGAEYTTTIGNNVSAQEDADANDTGGFRPDGGAALNFDFPLDLAQAPSVYQSAAITNLFYWNNVSHDIHYKYGFTEAAGNFQTNNYGRGGSGSDAVKADAQDGYALNNANFASPPDGWAPRMQMFRFSYTSPYRDGDLESMVMTHEYGHGVSGRLTGGPANANALDAVQSGGMGEGWSDWWGLMFTQKSTDTQNAAYPIGNYVVGQSGTGGGIRRYPYSYNMSTDPLTITYYNSSNEVHDVGEIWCSALWDMNWLLINKYGFDANIQNGLNPANIKGNQLALKLVMDALKLQPANPSFKDARDAILQADANLHNTLGTPLNQSEIWQAFARRGMGFNFADSSSSAASVSAAYDLPLPDPVVSTTTPASGNRVLPVSSIDLNFSEPMNPSSFSVADDLASFTGPGGANLVPTVSGYSWLNGNTTLRLDFTPTGSAGSYSIVVGPRVLSSDDGHSMDQNRNGVPGEDPADRFTLTFTYSPTLGPESFGYSAAAYPFQNIDLVPWASGVTSILDGADDSSTAIDLGTNSFRFYGQTYSGAGQLYISTNGLITFGSSSSSDYTNANLTSNPTQRAIAPVWDDWVTNRNSSGATNDVVLYKLEDTTGDSIPDRLIIEWSNVFQVSSSATSPITFQAILQLNTGLNAGRIILNYPDLDTGYTAYSNGGSATEGIKDTGPQGGNRLLVGYNDSSQPWVATGKAIVLGTDVVGPRINAESYSYTIGPSVNFTFNEDVSASLSTADLTVQNLTTATAIPTANLAMTHNSATNTASFTFPGYAHGVLPDGNYLATILSAGVSDPAGNPLDGDADGVIGGNHPFSFFVLAGDANHDRAVDIYDLGVLATNWQTNGLLFTEGDFNYDGVVDISDLGILASNWQTSLPAPAAPVEAAATPARWLSPANPGPSPFAARRTPRRTDDAGDVLVLI